MKYLSNMYRHVILLVVLLLCGLPAFATWSIIIVDPETRQIGIAGASCSYNCYGIGSTREIQPISTTGQ